MAEDSEEKVPVSGGHEHILQAHRIDDGEAMAVKPKPLGVCIADGIKMSDK